MEKETQRYEEVRNGIAVNCTGTELNRYARE